MWNKIEHNFIGCTSDFDEAEIVLFGAPFDSTTSFRPGARFGSKAIRNDSFGIETYSPYQDKDLCDYKIYDGGDLELCFGDTPAVLEAIEKNVDEIVQKNKIPFMLGGEHLITLGAVRSVMKKHSELIIVHFDAHTDLREDYLGAKFSHATVMKRCHDLLGDGRIFQFGIRSGEKAEFEFAEKHNFINKFNLSG
ncbi:MAG: agmatinase, partial [Oscillospiraceae bacterium]|nr:agmatinase [Oscillospiraceae bacterium]